MFGVSDYLRSLLAPHTCAHCKLLLNSPEIFCPICAGQITRVVSLQLHDLTIYAYGVYQDPLRTLIHGKLYGSRTASMQLGKLVATIPALAQLQFDIVVPIPLHWRRYAQRWFNQADVMAQEIGRQYNKPVVSLLRRQRSTQFQSKLSPDERQRNVRDVFVLKPGAFEHRGARILIVDDLVTTGATLVQAARAIQPLKPELVTAVVAARAT